MRGSEFGGVKIGSRLSFGFRCDKEMKPNPFGFNLNFDEFFGVKFGGPRLPKDLTAIPKPPATDLAGQRYRGIKCAEPRLIAWPRPGLSELLRSANLLKL
jgi:hypothetical protein